METYLFVIEKKKISHLKQEGLQQQLYPLCMSNSKTGYTLK